MFLYIKRQQQKQKLECDAKLFVSEAYISCKKKEEKGSIFSSLVLNIAKPNDNKSFQIHYHLMVIEKRTKQAYIVHATTSQCGKVLAHSNQVIHCDS